MAYKVCIINIGNELLLGKTINTNLGWLGNSLINLGLPVTRSIIIRDSYEDITETLRNEWDANDIIITTGGLGPTTDDITKKTIADFFGKKLEFREDIWEEVQDVFKRRKLPVPLINKSQAYVPESFIPLKNTIGTAPGLIFKIGIKTFIALPGVPSEMKSIFENHLRVKLSSEYKCPSLIIKNIHTWRISESALAEKLQDLRVPDTIQFAWLPQTGRVDLRIIGNDKNLIQEVYKKVYKSINEYIWGEDDETPQFIVYQWFQNNKKTLSVAESCTGGLVQELLTRVPGASKYMLGGVVAYSNDIKSKLLNVENEVLSKYGAVSSETAIEMAMGVKHLFQSDFGISITGIAGPDGGSLLKPVGTVFLGLCDNSMSFSKEIVFNGDRQSIRLKAAEYSLLLLNDFIRSRK